MLVRILLVGFFTCVRESMKYENGVGDKRFLLNLPANIVYQGSFKATSLCMFIVNE